jgi:mRNA interferase MazF
MWDLYNQLDQEYEQFLIQEHFFEVWNSTKQRIHFSKHKLFFKQREIWYCSLGINLGQEQNGKHEIFERPIVIFKKFNENLFLGFPLTSKEKVGKYYFSIIMPRGVSSVILSQIRVLDAKRLNRKIRTLNKKEFLELSQSFIKLIS